MGSFGKKSSATTKKKKGPKGRKARAKAKLERQWGEVAAIDSHKHGSTERIGKSRLAARLPQNDWEDAFENRRNEEEPWNEPSAQETQRQKQHYENDDDSSSMSEDDGSSSEEEPPVDDSDMDEDGEADAANPLNDLLSMIRKSKKKEKRRSVQEETMEGSLQEEDDEHQDDDDDDKSEQSRSSSSSEDGDSLSDGDDDMNQDELSDSDVRDDPDDNDEGNDSDKVDIFRQRFSRQPLSQEELQSLDTLAKSIQKIPIGSSSSIDLQVSSPLEGAAGMEELLSLKTNKEWQQKAEETFSGNTKALLQREWKRLQSTKHQQVSNDDENNFMGNVQAPLYSFLARYSDLFVTTGNGIEKHARREQRDLHRTYLLHILNHVLTRQSRISRNNKLLNEADRKREKEGDNEGDDDVEEEEDSDKYRDQGFTRPTVLVLLPTRGTCHAFVKDLYRLLGSEMDREQEERFEADYGPINAADDDEKQVDSEKERRRKAVLEQKGKEWNELFGESANQDDDFKVGISLLSKTAKKKQAQSNVSVRIYTDFFKSDIIVASPLGLKMLITREDEESEVNSDYLSSIEICLLQHSDVMMMQNWDHVNDILGFLNQQPENNNNTDFSRVRNYMLEGQGSSWRQLILSSKFMDPTLVSSFKRFGKSIAGSVKVRRKTPGDDASISHVLLPIKQVFQKIPVATFAKQSQAHVEYFLKNLLPQIQRQDQKHTMVYIPSYFDFCSLRNAFLKRDDVVFVSVTEYSRTSEIGRGRARFLQGRKPIMLYTGRAHYFHRHAIKGTQHLIFLGLPENPEFYAEHVNLIGSLGAASKRIAEDAESDLMGTSSTSCVALFTKYEAHALERIVGSSNCSRMLGSAKATFMFHS